MRRVNPDIVHIQFPTQGYDTSSGLAVIAFFSRFRHRVPVVVTLHEFLPSTMTRANLYIHALALIANRIVVVRPEYYAAIPWPLRLFIPETKIRFITNAAAVPRVELSETERQAVKQDLGCGAGELVAFFGFSYPHKGVDLLFRIADPSRHHLLLIGELSPDDAYHAQLLKAADSDAWRGRVTITGFVEPAQAGRLLAAADAVVFPYRVGGGTWNSSLHAATGQGTFALTTSRERNGYDAEANIYYALPEAVDEMRQALVDHGGARRRHGPAADPWIEIAKAHKELYASLVSKKAPA
jgi:glycosyltransferase involved in cell wall biosynthesis